MKTIPFSEISTHRLLLRRPQDADWETISYLRSDPIVNQYVKRPSAETEAKAKVFITRVNKEISTQVIYYWVITIKGIGQMIGSICLWNLNPALNTAELGYDLDPKFHKKGIMNEALESVLDFGFNQLDVDRVEAYTQHQNTPSRKLLERNGFLWIENRRDEDNPDNLIYERRR